MEKDFKFIPKIPLSERDRTLDEDSYRRMSEGGKKGGAAGAGIPKYRGLMDSKYDPVLDAFLDSLHKLVKVVGPSGYVFTRQLNLRIESRKLEKEIRASTINDVVYLEKLWDGGNNEPEQIRDVEQT